jgi:hypothetical protein
MRHLASKPQHVTTYTMHMCEKYIEDQPLGTVNIVLQPHIRNKFNNRELEKIIDSDVKNILKG